jgi:hypothetical protein
MDFYILTEEYCFGGETTFEVLGAYKLEEQAIKAMKHQHEKNMSLRPWRLRDKDDIHIEENNNSMYVLDETDAEHYYLLEVKSILLQD